MRISVVVPHLNQHRELVDCLASLHEQFDPPEHLEIIVVDNGSATPPAAECSVWPGVAMVVEREPGPGPARNRGVREASDPDVLAFVDADCTVDPHWLESIARAFDDPTIDIIGGDIRLGFRDESRPEPIELYETIYSYRNELHIAEGFSGTGNLAVRGSVWAQVGQFGGKEIAEDRDWGLRAHAAGFRIVYVPAMIVYHPARRSFDELRLKWDRHVAHDVEHYAQGRIGLVRWIVRAVAVAASPLAEIGTIARSDRLSGAWQRLVAFGYLCRVRWYRCRAMVRVAVTGSSRERSRAWNVQSPSEPRSES